jgi:nucleoid-associated protein YgaU
MGLVSALGMVGCSHSAGTSDSDVPPADAGTDAVPQAAVDGSNPNDPNAAPPTAAAPGADGAPAATADAGAPPPPPADSASTPPPAPDAPPPAPPVDNASAPPAAPAAPTDTAAAPAPSAPVAAAPAPAAPSVATSSSGGSGGVGPQDYTVQRGDTLMKIAFQTYGDLYKWHDIYQANQDRIKNPNDVPPGTVLKIDQPSVPVSIERNGDQYLIKVGDTLGTISTDVYGSKRKWKKLYENNKQMIKDPNKIYAGFYLFYTLTPEERQQLEQRGGPGQSKPLADNADGGSSEPQAAADPAPDANAPQAPGQPAAGQPQAAAAPAPQADARMPASVPPAPAQQVAKAPVQAGAPSDDLNQVAQQPH